MIQTSERNRDAGSAGLRLLVVDDHRDSADSLALLLGLWGHRPRVAYDGRTALQMAREDPPDAILLDLGLPGRDGCGLADDLRRQEGWAGAPLIAVTGFGDRVHRDRAQAAGFDHFLVKPVEPDSLRDLLGSLLELRLLACRMDRLAQRHAELAREAEGLVAEAREQVRELRERMSGSASAAE
jgi:CheY-like chemotaxis protein